MHFTHTEAALLLLFVGLVVGMLAGWQFGHFRAYQECCDCCTCQDCGEWDDEYVGRPGAPAQRGLWPEVDTVSDPGPARSTWVLEPGPTIYPALAELAGEALDGPESHAERTELVPWTQEPSTWLRTIRLDWETRYPIRQEAL